MIRIKCEGGMAYSARIENMDGTTIDGVTGLRLVMDPNDFVRAELEIRVGSVDVQAHPLLGLETVKEAAAAHGYRLVPAGG